MLYLEDYLEMIEHLPQELRDRFTEMREMDLQVQNAMDSLEERVKTFFNNAKKMKPSEREAEYEAIRRDYYKALEDADEKVQLANQMYDLVDRYLRRLDQELHKFKMELEVDNKGITEVLEKRSLELDHPSQNSSQKENRFIVSTPRIHQEKKQQPLSTILPVEKKNTVVEKASQETQAVSTSGGLQGSAGSISYSLGHMGAGGNAIAAAASQAIAATQQMQQGRRTASLKASYEAINLGVHTHEFSIGRELAGAAQSAIAASGVGQDPSPVVAATPPPKRQKNKKNSNSAAASAAAAAAVAAAAAAATPATAPAAAATTVTAVTQAQTPEQPEPAAEEPPQDVIVDLAMENPDWTFDPNEPRYCICNQVSYGDMVACDNDDCPFEWFHYPCVGIHAPPKGKWYCPQCTAAMKRRGRGVATKKD